MANIDESIKHDELFAMPHETEITKEVLKKYIEKHRALVTSRYKKLYDAYIGDYPILLYDKKESYKPDNRIVVNFAKYIVDTMNGFFIGIPIKVSSTDKVISEYVNLLDSYNDQDDNNAELSKICSMYGKGYEMYYVDSNGLIRIIYLNPMEAFMIYDDTVEQNPICFVNYFINEDEVMSGTLYDGCIKREFSDKDGLHFIDEGNIHGFDGVPATEFIENEERMAVFESVYSQINEYNKAISEKANDVDYFADAYMKILGAKLDEVSQNNIRSNRIINFEGDSAEKMVVEFMDKPNSDATQENLINRLERLIFQNSMIANLNDENFGTSSGIALKYKLLSMSNLAKTKERKVTSGMNRRYRIIFSNPVNSLHSDDFVKLQYKFTQNFPANVLEEAQIAAQFSGITSKETQLGVISVIDDVSKELEAIKKDSDTLTYRTDYPTQRTADDKEVEDGHFNVALG